MRQSAFFVFIFFLVGCAEDGVVDPNLFFPGGETNTTEKAALIQGLALPLRLDFIKPKEVVVQRSPKALRMLNSQDSDYQQDQIETTLKDVSMQPLQRVNFLLCLLAQTKISEKVNRGAYQVWVNQQKCQQDNIVNNQDQSWVVEVTRLDNNSPQKVKVWVSDFTSQELAFTGKKATELLIELDVLSGVRSDLPYGHFQMNFSTLMPSPAGVSGGEIIVTKSALWSVQNSEGESEVGFITLKNDALAENDETFFVAESLRFILMGSEGSVGRAVSYQTQYSGSVEGETRFAAAFNAGYFYRAEDRDNDGLLEFNSRLCQARSEFDWQVPRYRLYHAEDGVFEGDSVLAGEQLLLGESGLINGAPLLFRYQHSRANDLNDQLAWAGEEFFLQYGVAGALLGLPAKISLKAGTVLSNQSHSFVLKPETQQQVMHSVDENRCADLDIDSLFYDSAVSLPEVSQLKSVGFGFIDQPLGLINSL